ncbi:MAG: hypothetical protein ACK5RL_08740 [Acidimicrobiales bacterium]
MRGRILAGGLAATLLVTAGCNDDTDTDTGAAAATVAAAGEDGTAADDGGATTTAPSAREAPSSTLAPEVIAGPDQQVVWPAADVLFTTPEEAAEDFMVTGLGVPAEVGTFRAGDPTSGEIDLLFAGEGGAAEIVRGVANVRVSGDEGGWWVVSVSNPAAEITSLDYAEEVPAGPLVVEGNARGFEGTVVVSAHRSGESGALDQDVVQAGSLADAEPFTAELDLSTVSPGTVVVIMVRGDTGVEGDSGEIGALPVVIAG